MKAILSSSVILTVSALSANAATLINTYPSDTTSNITVLTSSVEPNTSVNGGDRTVILENNGAVGNGFNNLTGEHGANTQSSWRSANAGTLADQWIQWDLGAVYQLDSIQLWNYNDSARYAAGVRQVDIFVAESFTGAPIATPGSEASGNGWTLWAANAILTAAPGTAGYTGYDLETAIGSSLPSSNIRYVRFEVDSTFRSDGIDLGGGTNDGTNVAGIAQIEFFAVPEPSAVLLGGLGSILLLRRRRH